MTLSIKELNELVYCIGSCISEQSNGYGHKERKELYCKFYNELESRLNKTEENIITLKPGRLRPWRHFRNLKETANIKQTNMNLSLKELNELIYCVGSVIADQPNGYGHKERQELFNKVYAELEKRVKYIEDNIVPLKDYELDQPDTSTNVPLSYRGRTY